MHAPAPSIGTQVAWEYEWERVGAHLCSFRRQCGLSDCSGWGGCEGHRQEGSFLPRLRAHGLLL